MNLGGWLHLTVGSLRGKIEGFPALGQSSEEAAGPRSPVGRRGEGNLFQINRSGQQSHRSNYLPRLFVLDRRPPRVAALGRLPPGWQLPQTDLFTGIDSRLCDYWFRCYLHIQSKLTHLEIRILQFTAFLLLQSVRLPSDQSQPLTVENFGC